MSLEQALAENTVALNALAAALAGSKFAPTVVNIDTGAASVGTTKPARQTKQSAQPAASETTQLPSAPAADTPAAPASQQPQAAAASLNVNHLMAVTAALIKKGKVEASGTTPAKDHKAEAVAIFAKYKNSAGQPVKSVPMIQLADYPAVYAELSALLPADELAAVLATIPAQAA